MAGLNNSGGDGLQGSFLSLRRFPETAARSPAPWCPDWQKGTVLFREAEAQILRRTVQGEVGVRREVLEPYEPGPSAAKILVDRMFAAARASACAYGGARTI